MCCLTTESGGDRRNRDVADFGAVDRFGAPSMPDPILFFN
jgi:hypothetical protein